MTPSTVRVGDGTEPVTLVLWPEGIVTVIGDDGETRRSIELYGALSVIHGGVRIGADFFSATDETSADQLDSFAHEAEVALNNRLERLQEQTRAKEAALAIERAQTRPEHAKHVSLTRAPSKQASLGLWIAFGALVLGPILTYLFALLVSAGKSSSHPGCEDPYFGCAFELTPKEETFFNALVGGGVITLLVFLGGLFFHLVQRIK